MQRATAHPHVADDGTVYNLGFSNPNKTPCYAILSLPDGKIEKSKIEAEIPCRWKFNPGYIHSFGLTENYYILSESPLSISVLQLLKPVFMGNSLRKSMNFYKKQNTKFRIICRKTGKELTTNYFAPDFFNFHYMNCFESNGCLILDVCATDDNIIDVLDMTNLQRKRDDPKRILTIVEPRRYVLPIDNLDSVNVNEELLANVPEAKISREDFLASASAVKLSNGDVFVKGVVISDTFMELPRINYRFNTKPYKYAYGARISDYKKNLFDLDGINKINVQTGEEKIWQDEDYFTSEPVFVERPDSTAEDDGAVITILLHKSDPRKLALLVLDAVTLTEMARVKFVAEGTVTPTFHGQFIRADDKAHTY